jgi:5-hydroxyisourate hydrolase
VGVDQAGGGQAPGGIHHVCDSAVVDVAPRTDGDGRVGSIGPERLEAGDYRLRFASGGYFAARGVAAFYPEVVVVFTIADADQHYHVPVLLNPFGYSTYRGS